MYGREADIMELRCVHKEMYNYSEINIEIFNFSSTGVC